MAINTTARVAATATPAVAPVDKPLWSEEAEVVEVLVALVPETVTVVAFGVELTVELLRLFKFDLVVRRTVVVKP